jgi:hypothetical protein
MRRGFGLVGLLATVILLVIVGAIAYNIGYSDGLSTHLPAVANGDGAPANYYGYGRPFGDGFGFFGILWFLLILFGIFWLFRLAFWGFWGRRMWSGGWGYGRGFGPGQGRWGSFEERAQEWHRRQHGEQPPQSGETPPPPPADTRSV